MPSLRTIFLLATAAFASFTYAAPMSETSSGVTTPFTGTTPNNLALLPLPNTGNSNGNSQGVQAANPAAKRGSAPDSLPVILKALEAKLQGILGELRMCEVFSLSYNYSAMIGLHRSCRRCRGRC